MIEQGFFLHNRDCKYDMMEKLWREYGEKKLQNRINFVQDPSADNSPHHACLLSTSKHIAIMAAQSAQKNP
jgi:hypothetical protein